MTQTHLLLPPFLLLVAVFLLALNMKTGKTSPVGKALSYYGMWAVTIWAIIDGVSVYS